MMDEAPGGAALLSEERQHEHEDGGWNLVPTCFPFLPSSTTSSKSTTHKKKKTKNYLLLLLLLVLALVAVLSGLNLFPPAAAVAVSSASLLLGVEEQDQQEEQGKRKRTSSIEDDIDDGTIITVMRPHDQDDAGGREKVIPSPTTTVVSKSALDYAGVVGTRSSISDSEDATSNKITKNKDNPPTTTPMIRASMTPEKQAETNPPPHSSNDKERGGALSHPATSIMSVPKDADGEDHAFLRKEEGGGVDQGGSRQLQQELEITQIQQLDRERMVVDGSFDSAVYSYPCSNIISTFNKNVTMELQVTCDAAPELSDNDKNTIGSAYVRSYNGLRSTVCDPFRLEVTAAKVVETGDLRGGGTSLPLMIEVTMVCYGCDPLGTNVYGIPDFVSSTADASSTSQDNETRRYLYAPNNNMQTRSEQEQGKCTCNSTLPRRSPLEADVTDAFDLTLLQQEDLVVSCLGNTTTCDFGTTFSTTALFEVELDDSLAPLEVLAEVLQTSFTNALNRLIAGGDATQCNAYFGFVTYTDKLLDFVYNSVARSANETARRELQNLPTVAPTSDLTFMFSWSASGVNTTEAPSAAPTVQVVGTELFLLDVLGVCNGCPTEIVFNDNVNARRRVDQIGSTVHRSASMTEFRFLQDITGLEPESQCFCPIGSVQIVTDFEQISFLEIIQEEVAKIRNTTTVAAAVSGITRVDCVDETPFSTTLNFAFSAFEWVVNNPADVQGLGDAIASIYNGLVEEFCDEYFRNSVSLTYVVGSLQRISAQRHDRDLQNTQGCFNYRARFSVAGLCRGCQALGTPIPLFGNSTTTNRKLDEVKRQPSPPSRQQRRLTDAGTTCVCDRKSISQRSAPSREAVRAGLEGLITSLPWAQNPSICGLPVEVESTCPLIPTGPSATLVARFYARRFNNGCLTAADLLQIAAHFTTAFNSREQLERFPCEPQYLQVSNVVIDPSTLGSCRRELLRGGKKNDDDGESRSHDGVTRQLRQDFSLMPVSMTITGNIWATNLAVILAGAGTTLMAAAADITAISGGVYEIYVGRATSSPSAMPTTEAPCLTTSDSCTGDLEMVQDWCDSFRAPDACCVSGACAWSGKATISKGACVGTDACTFASKLTTIIVGRNSCNGEEACNLIAINKGTSVKIGDDSCRGDLVCYGIGYEQGISVEIGNNSCLDYAACLRIGFSDGSGGITVGTGACNAIYGCTWVGENKAKSVMIGENSCTGVYACESVGRNAATSVTISASACTTSACGTFTTCFRSGGAGAVTCDGCTCSFIFVNPTRAPSLTASPNGAPACPTASDSCTGPLETVQDWCNSLTGSDVCCYPGACAWNGQATISKGACVGTDACMFAPSLTTITVGKNSCKGEEACNLIAINTGTSVKIGDDSCRGDLVCYGIGYIKGISVEIGNNSCLDYAACLRIGFSDGSGGITVGTGACNAIYGCTWVGETMANPVMIGDNSCRGAYACQEVGRFEATSVAISASACTTSACGIYTSSACWRYDVAGDVTCTDCGCSTPPPTSFPSPSPSKSADPTTAPSPKPSSSPSSSPQPTRFPTEALCPTSVNSCTGPTGGVIPWCAGDCCVDGPVTKDSGPACDWGGTATIFKGSCKGSKACSFAPSFTSITVGAGSCIGTRACDNNGFDVATASISIGTNSCLEDYACIQLAWLKGDTVSIDNDSCHGVLSCNGLGYSEGTIVSVGANSCIGYLACQFVGGTAAKSVSIGTGSCNGDAACNILGDYQATSVTIKDATCTDKVCNNDPTFCGGDPGDDSYRYKDISGDVTCEVCECMN